MPETRDPHVIVVRTFSKVFGMAGVRVGYAVAAPETAARLSEIRWDTALNRLAIAGALAAIGDTAALAAEQRRNRDARASVMNWFRSRGLAPAESNTNFVFVDIKRGVQPVIAACFNKGVAVGRPFPPLLSHLRVSIGTQAEMDAALRALGEAHRD
jgi:histidinol-phosphate aminotransferase